MTISALSRLDTIIPTAIQRIGSYDIQRLLGSGGLADVYLAIDRNLGCQVAVKRLRASLVAADLAADPLAERPNLAQRFLREWQALGALDHPHIVRARFAGEDDGIPYLVMDYVAGEDLESHVARHGVPPVADTCRWLAQACQGLQYAHDKGIVHRDLKPSNLLIDGAGKLQLVDFGIARHAVESSDGCSGTSWMTGTPDFIAPEQIEEANSADARADIYSLGCTLYFLLFGKPPFSHYESLAGKLAAHRSESPRYDWSAVELAAAPRRQLQGLLEAMLAKSPDQRPASAIAVEQALSEIVTALARPRSNRYVNYARRRWLAVGAVTAAAWGVGMWFKGLSVATPLTLQLQLQHPTRVIPEDCPLRVNLLANRDCRVFLFRRAANGSIDLLLPNAMDAGNLLLADQPRIVPDKSASWELYLSPPFGPEEFFVVAVDQNVKCVWTELSIARLLQTLHRQSASPAVDELCRELTKTLPAEAWTSARCQFESQSAVPKLSRSPTI